MADGWTNEDKVPQTEHKKRILKEDKERSKSLKVTSTHYEWNGDELLKVTKKTNGNVYRTYVGKKKGKNAVTEDFLKTIRTQIK